MSLYERPWEPTLALGRRALAKGLRTLRREQVIERNWEVQYLGGSRPDRLQDLLRSSVPGTAGLSSTDVQGFIDTFLHAPDGTRGYSADSLLTLGQASVTRAGTASFHGLATEAATLLHDDKDDDV